MSDELVKQWGEYVESMGSVMGDVEHIAQQMCDRIESLQAERDKWKTAFDESCNAWQQQCEHEMDRANKAEAERDRLRAVLSVLLEEYLSDVDPYRVAGFYRDPETEDCVVKARAALKGETP